MKSPLTKFTAAVAFAALAFAGCTKREAEAEKEKAAEKHDDKTVTLTREQLAHVEIKTETAATGDLDMTLKAAGRVSENMNKTAKVASTLDGRIAKLNADINDPVKTGDVLALVQTPELMGKPLELKAPIDGLVIERNQAVGELVDKTSAVYVISDPADLWVIAEIKERDLAAVKVGQVAAFAVLAYPEEAFRGKVVRIAHKVETDSRTVEARIEVRNEDGRLKPGMFADVEITTTVLKGVLVISDAAVQTDGDKQVVFLALDGSKFEKREVKLGLTQHGRVQVLAGLKPGDQIATEGSFILKSELLKGELGEE
ncbi:MAG: rane fusion protein heavy metal efflux system [Chthoniobacter sp.]|jgi:cobalt-zinc-cadmium efflux system membrane fusion protein|nr:rane fusion protein heavy metal efflux system [Chthoniobacter sp.]